MTDALKRTPEQILADDWCPKFIDGMRERILVSGYKYGRAADAVGKVDFEKSARTRINLYLRGDEMHGIAPGNTEYLMDAANFLMLEFMFPGHRHAHFLGTDDSGSIGRVSSAHGGLDKRPHAEMPIKNAG